MATFERGPVRIQFTDEGAGFPVLLIAPGGMRSQSGAWARAPWHPAEQLREQYRVIAMDQRNAGGSWGPISAAEGWGTYTTDQLALMDHLGVDRFAVVGMCIGGPYIARLATAAPERVAAAVMLQPIGLDDNREDFFALFDGWAEEIREQHPEVEDDAVWRSFRDNMFGGDFMFGASRNEVAALRTPLLVALGNDRYHPASISEEVAALAPNAQLLERWKAPEDQAAARETIERFLAAHSKASSNQRS